ncbi:MAG: N-acetylglucosamine-6-phosphate deacetylase [Planctomycetota bacterium]|jgi:N-acetylglucosamine-6-phosphate deacetylase
MLAVLNGTVVLPNRLLQDGMVLIDGERIQAVSKRKRLPRTAIEIDARGGWITPGFVDIHVHGGGGADFMDGTVDAVLQVCRSHLRHGTTTLFPTTTTGSVPHLLEMITACRAAKKLLSKGGAWGAAIAGIHLYGPYFAADKAGCHERSECRAPEAEEFRQYFRTKMIRIATCAAELPGAEAFWRAANKQGCLITCGHSNASWGEMARAFAQGMRHVDHFWCAMSSVPSLRQRFGTPMQASMAEFVLMNPEMSTEVIADGCHLSPELLEFAAQMLGANRLCLVTDCNRALDMPPGDYIFGRHDCGTAFRSDGDVGWAPSGSLASAVMGMDHMVRQMRRSTTVGLEAVIRMASLTPAERTGISSEVGSLEAGKLADVLVLGEDLEIRHTVLRGRTEST